jgi:excisionase family DNA binding protein
MGAHFAPFPEEAAMNDKEQAGVPYTAQEAAERLDVDVKTVYEGIRKGDIPAFRVSGVIRIPRPAFNELLRSGKVA